MRMWVLIPLLVAAASAALEHARLDTPLPCASDGDYYQYDDGSAYWLLWDGRYKAVWFDPDDFWPDGPLVFGIISLELWFYHHSSCPWDVSSFYGELWEGDSSGPAILEGSESVTALHYAPVDAFVYYPSYTTQFWGIANCSMSSGGWPSLLADNTPGYYNHSFVSDDFETWTPWIRQGPTSNDFFIRGELDWWYTSLDHATWASIKSLWGCEQED